LALFFVVILGEHNIKIMSPADGTSNIGPQFAVCPNSICSECAEESRGNASLSGRSSLGS